MTTPHDDIITWKHFLLYWPFVWGIHRSLVTSPHKGQWHGALRFSLICTWINAWVNNLEAGDLRRHRAQYDVIVMHAHHNLKVSTLPGPASVPSITNSAVSLFLAVSNPRPVKMTFSWFTVGATWVALLVTCLMTWGGGATGAGAASIRRPVVPMIGERTSATFAKRRCNWYSPRNRNKDIELIWMVQLVFT